MNDWTQPICSACYAAWSLGQGHSPRRQPARVRSVVDPCLICGDVDEGDGTIYIRADPALTDGLVHAREKDAAPSEDPG